VNGIQNAEALLSRHKCRRTPRKGSIMTTVTRVLKIKLTMMATPKADNGSTIFSFLFKKIPTPFPAAVKQTPDEIGLYV
jgi:hypothetical protein